MTCRRPTGQLNVGRELSWWRWVRAVSTLESAACSLTCRQGVVWLRWWWVWSENKCEDAELKNWDGSAWTPVLAREGLDTFYYSCSPSAQLTLTTQMNEGVYAEMPRNSVSWTWRDWYGWQHTISSRWDVDRASSSKLRGSVRPFPGMMAERSSNIVHCHRSCSKGAPGLESQTWDWLVSRDEKPSHQNYSRDSRSLTRMARSPCSLLKPV